VESSRICMESTQSAEPMDSLQDLYISNRIYGQLLEYLYRVASLSCLYGDCIEIVDSIQNQLRNYSVSVQSLYLSYRGDVKLYKKSVKSF